jgi:hypothetical protein
MSSTSFSNWPLKRPATNHEPLDLETFLSKLKPEQTKAKFRKNQPEAGRQGSVTSLVSS